MGRLLPKLFIPYMAAWLMALPSHEQARPLPNWQNLDLQQDSVFGISTERAYRELPGGKQATTVVVAVIDVGVDTGHEAPENPISGSSRIPRRTAGAGC